MADDVIGIEANTAVLEGAMMALRKGVRDGLIDPQYGTLGVQGRLLAQRCQDFTPPRNVGQGNVAVVRDLSRIYFPQSSKTYKNARMRKIVMNDDRAAWDRAAEHFTGNIALRGTRAIAFSEQWHRQNRDARGRAVRGKYGHIGIVTLGPQGALAREYIKKVKARVGWARAGWNMGIIAFGGQVSAGWVARHSIIRGSVTDGRADYNPFVAFTNDTGWAKYNRGEGERIVRNATLARIRDISAYAERMTKLAAERAFKQAA